MPSRPLIFNVPLLAALAGATVAAAGCVLASGQTAASQPAATRPAIELLPRDAAPRPAASVYHAEVVEGSEVLAASGLCWWNDRLIVADRANKRLIAYTPPAKFETLKELTHPVGVAVDPTGRLVFTEKEKDGVNRLARLDQGGREETIVTGDAAGTPHFLAVHASGTIFWSGFPDGGTRSLRPGGEPAVLGPRIVHTYGIGLSPDGRWLYVASKIPNPDRRGVWRFPVDKDGRAGEGEFFLQVQNLRPEVPGLPPPKDGQPTLLGWVGRLQGLAVDELGYLYIAGAESHHSGAAVAVVTPDGKQVAAMILGVPTNVSGLAFGGPDGRTLFITGAGNYRLHQVRLPAAGAAWRPPEKAGAAK